MSAIPIYFIYNQRQISVGGEKYYPQFPIPQVGMVINWGDEVYKVYEVEYVVDTHSFNVLLAM